MKQHIRWSGAICLMLTMAFVGIGPLTAIAHGPLHERMDRVAKQIEKAPRDAALYYERAVLHREHGDLEIARADLEHSLSLEPKDLTTQCEFASVLLECGEATPALEGARAILVVTPEHPRARLVEARALVALEQLEEAIDGFDRLIERGPPPSPDLVLERFRTVRTADPTNTREAIRGLETGIARIGPLVSLVLPAIEIERASGFTDRALARVEQLKDQAGRKTLWLVLEAEILAEAGRADDSRKRAAEARSQLANGPRRNSSANIRLSERLVAVEHSIRHVEARRRTPIATHSEPRGDQP